MMLAGLFLSSHAARRRIKHVSCQCCINGCFRVDTNKRTTTLSRRCNGATKKAMRKRNRGVAHPAPAHRLQLQAVPEDFAISPPCAYLMDAAARLQDCVKAWLAARQRRALALASATTTPQELAAVDAAVAAACEAIEAASAALAAQEAAAVQQQQHGEGDER